MEERKNDYSDEFEVINRLWGMIEGSEDFVRKNIRLFGFRTQRHTIWEIFLGRVVFNEVTFRY